jgi:hypothetical protein
MDEKCKECKWLFTNSTSLSVTEEPSSDNAYGFDEKEIGKETVVINYQCRYSPPNSSGWPIVQLCDFCGKFERD